MKKKILLLQCGRNLTTSDPDTTYPVWIQSDLDSFCHSVDRPSDTLQSRRDKGKLKWWYKLATLPEDRYPKQLFNQKWNIKPRRGRQRKVWSRMVDDLFKSLDIDKSEWLEDIKHGDSSSASFMASVEECISERESRKFEEGLNTKVKLGMYKRFGKSIELKKYLHGICDAGSRLLFKFRSGTHGLNEELGRHRSGGKVKQNVPCVGMSMRM